MDFFDEQLNNEAALTASPGRSIKKKEETAAEGILTVDVFQTDDEIIIKSTIAGVSGDDIDIAVTKDTVTIKGSRKTEEKIREPDYYYRELYWGAFSRSIILPEDVDPDGAKASMKNGLLTIRLPKLAKTRTQKIKISL